MTFETVPISRWTGSFRSSTRLLAGTGLGMSFVLVMLCPTHWIQDKKYHSSHTVEHAIRSESSQTDLQCHQVEPAAIISSSAGKFKDCRGCAKKLSLDHFPPKGGGRRESRCKDCHNRNRRSHYQGRIKPESELSFKFSQRHFNEKHEGFQLLLDLVCDDVMKGTIG